MTKFQIEIADIISICGAILFFFPLVMYSVKFLSIRDKHQSASDFISHKKIIYIYIGLFVVYLFIIYVISEKSWAYFKIVQALPSSKIIQIFRSNIFLILIAVSFLIISVKSKSRLLWILFIFFFECLILFSFIDILKYFFSDISKEHASLISGITTLLLSTPILFLVWIYRDNDRYTEIINKSSDLEYKKKELLYKKFEYELKEKEYELKEKEYELKKDEYYLNKKKVILMLSEFDIKYNPEDLSNRDKEYPPSFKGYLEFINENISDITAPLTRQVYTDEISDELKNMKELMRSELNKTGNNELNSLILLLLSDFIKPKEKPEKEESKEIFTFKNYTYKTNASKE